MRTQLTFWVLLVGLLVPGLALGVATQETESFESLTNNPYHMSWQMIRCDNSTSISNANGDALGGQLCEAGDWTTAVDCRGMSNISIRYFEYSAQGTSVAKIWDCTLRPGPVGVGSTLGGSEPGVEDPSSAPSAADPDPMCVSLDDGVPVVIDGANPGVQVVNLSEQELHFIVGEIHACTDCDSTLIVSCGR